MIHRDDAIPIRAGDIAVQPPERSPCTDHFAFEQLVAAHHATVRQLVFRLLGWRDGGDDVAQEVFLAAWANRRRLSKVENVEFWLKRIAINKCRSHLRRAAVRARWRSWIERSPPQEPLVAADGPLAASEHAETIRNAINALKPRYREVIVLHYLEELTVTQIAKITGIRANTIEVRLHRARQQLAEQLKDLADDKVNSDR